jgi:predicted metalloendopeptidase
LRAAYAALGLGDAVLSADDTRTAQRFFLSFAQTWCSTESTNGALTAPRMRVNGSLRDMPAFAQAFGCDATAPLSATEVCQAW